MDPILRACAVTEDLHYCELGQGGDKQLLRSSESVEHKL